MSTCQTTRRAFLQQSAAACAAVTVPYWITSTTSLAQGTASANDRPRVGLIGAGGRGMGIAQEAAALGDIVAVCDVDQKHAAQAKEAFGGKPDAYGDYRQVLDRKDIDVILNATPDHWHTIINVAACKAGKDLYAEKPITLTIDEGKILCRVVEETGRIVQVGTQQRSEKQFQTAIELVRNGRIGKLQEVTVTLPFWSTKGGPFAMQPVPSEMNWDMYQGQAPRTRVLLSAHALRQRWRLAVVVRVRRRHHHRLGQSPHGHRPLGHGPGAQRPADDRGHGELPQCRTARLLQHARSLRDRDDVSRGYRPALRRACRRKGRPQRDHVCRRQGTRVRESRRSVRKAGGRTGRQPAARQRLARAGQRQPHGEFLPLREDSREARVARSRFSTARSRPATWPISRCDSGEN